MVWLILAALVLLGLILRLRAAFQIQGIVEKYQGFVEKLKRHKRKRP